MDSHNTYKDKNPFVVPEHYFEQFSDRVMNRVKRQERSILKKFRPNLKWAAVFVIGVTGVWMAYVVSISGEGKPNESLENRFAIESKEETIFDSKFNPTSEEVIEYLVSEVEDYEMLIAGNY